jgi:pyruvate dehydrogenase E1 component alpha subunit
MQISSPDAPAAVAQSEPVQLLTPDGNRVASETYDPWITDVTGDQLLSLYEDLVLVRRIDTEATALQRQGELGLWAPLHGQEAAQVGSARTLRPEDFVFPSYREHGVAFCRGVDPIDLLKLWRGTAGAGWDPADVGIAVPSIVIGAQTLHAVGYAMGERFEHGSGVAVTYFGDGATTQGDVSEAMVFAASFNAPVVFFCQNNQWAISEPVALQSKQPLANRPAGFGIPAIRVDGNDVLAVMAAMRSALDRARKGDGPTFIEAVTFRMGPHTTSDDPTRYVDPLLREEWAAKDPIARLETHLRDLGLLDDEAAAAIAERAEELAVRLRDGVRALEDPPALGMFDHVYAEPQRELARQRSQYAAYLEGLDS